MDTSDISYSSVLDGVREFFQGVPGANNGGENLIYPNNMENPNNSQTNMENGNKSTNLAKPNWNAATPQQYNKIVSSSHSYYRQGVPQNEQNYQQYHYPNQTQYQPKITTSQGGNTSYMAPPASSSVGVPTSSYYNPSSTTQAQYTPKQTPPPPAPQSRTYASMQPPPAQYNPYTPPKTPDNRYLYPGPQQAESYLTGAKTTQVPVSSNKVGQQPQKATYSAPQYSSGYHNPSGANNYHQNVQSYQSRPVNNNDYAPYHQVSGDHQKLEHQRQLRLEEQQRIENEQKQKQLAQQRRLEEHQKQMRLEEQHKQMRLEEQQRRERQIQEQRRIEDQKRMEEQHRQMYNDRNLTIAKRETPLDLSVHTVKYSADSTYEDRKHHKWVPSPSASYVPTPQNSYYYGAAQTASPKIDFQPNFSITSTNNINQSNLQKPITTDAKIGTNNNYGANNYSHLTKNNYAYSQTGHDWALGEAQRLKSLPEPKRMATLQPATTNYDMYNISRKRTSNFTPNIANKVPKLESWRKTIDEQIDLKFKSYKNNSAIVATPHIMQHQYQSGVNSATKQNKYSANYITPTPRGHPPIKPNDKPSVIYDLTTPEYSQYSYDQKPIVPTVTLNPNYRNPAATNNNYAKGADKRTLSLLRHSIENKNSKEKPAVKMEYPTISSAINPMAFLHSLTQGKNNPFFDPKYDRPIKVEEASTLSDILQIKNGNPFSNKHFGEILKAEEQYAYLAAKIKTKAELKQMQQENMAPRFGDVTHQQQSVIVKQELPDPNFPIKVEKDDGESNSKREKSVFDFDGTDSDDEKSALEKQLEERRKSGKYRIRHSTEIKQETVPESPTEEDLNMFSSACDSFITQLKTGVTKKERKGKPKVEKVEKLEKIEKVEKPKNESHKIVIKVEVDDIDGDRNIRVKSKINDENVFIGEYNNIGAKKEEIVFNNYTLKNNNKTPEKGKGPLKFRKNIDDSSNESMKFKDQIIVNTINIQNKCETPEKKTKNPIKNNNESNLNEKPKLDEIYNKQNTLSETKEVLSKYKLKRGETTPEKRNNTTPEKKNTTAPEKRNNTTPEKSDVKIDIPLIIRPVPKPTFGDGSDFYPGWEEEVYKYKKSLRMPPSLIKVAKPTINNCRLSSSLPDLNQDESPAKTRNKLLSDVLDSDTESNSSLHLFSARNNYDSEGSASCKSLPNLKEHSILDRLLERCGSQPYKKRKALGARINMPLVDKPNEEKKEKPKECDNLINKTNIFVGVNKEFTTVVLKTRTRKKTQEAKKKATIAEIFGEDRPASAPPLSCHANVKQEPEEVLETDEILKDQSEPVIKSETPIKAEDKELPLSVKKRNKFLKIRRKFNSGLDYLRKKKKKVKSADGDNKKGLTWRSLSVKQSPASVEDIEREIRTWVLNKGVGESHLHRSARLHFADITAFCLENMGCPPSPKDNAGFTPLHEACSKGYVDVARLLLLYGANVNETAQGGIRPLHEAVENGYLEVVRLLLSYGADPTIATYSGLTPLALASEDDVKEFLENHLHDTQGRHTMPWVFQGPASFFEDPENGYDIICDPPSPDQSSDLEDIEMEVSEFLLPNLYTLKGETPSDRWMLLQDLSNALKIKSRDSLMRHLCPSSTPMNFKSFIRELKITEFLEKAHCCQFLNAGEKLNTRASKVALIKYTDKVRELLNVEQVVITTR